MIKKLRDPRLLFLSTALLISAAAGAFLLGGISAGSESHLETAGQAHEAQPDDAYSGRVRIFVHGDDIYPDTLSLRPGRVLLAAENETQSDISLVVERVTSGQVKEAVAKIRTLRQGKRGQQELRLGAGHYIYYEESRPDVQGSLIVEPK
jgi:hypothetical protein